MNKKFTIRDITNIGVFAALVFVFSNISITIPLGFDNTRLHLGNVLCLTAAIVLGPMKGGLSAGIGSMLFDLTNPLFLAFAPYTFVFKFLMAYVAGKVSYSKNKNGLDIKTNFIGSGLGSITYVILYLCQSFVLNLFLDIAFSANILLVLQKATVSFTNAALAVTFSVPIAQSIKKGLKNIT
ncbi:MAG: ECF transporter S component [Oscillospiraceae bacterium]